MKQTQWPTEMIMRNQQFARVPMAARQSAAALWIASQLSVDAHWLRVLQLSRFGSRFGCLHHHGRDCSTAAALALAADNFALHDEAAAAAAAAAAA